jgi:plasmid maintenance system antidote protein VapI
MKSRLEILKGLHPGILIGKELKKRKIPGGRFAIAINEYPRTLSAIISGRRSIDLPLSLKIEKELDYDEGFLMTLQLYHDIKMLKLKESEKHKPDLSKFRKVIFWDTDIQRIDWIKNKRAVIERVFERGNDTEKDEIIRFYGQKEVDLYLNRYKEYLDSMQQYCNHNRSAFNNKSQ